MLNIAMLICFRASQESVRQVELVIDQHSIIPNLYLQMWKLKGCFVFLIH